MEILHFWLPIFVSAIVIHILSFIIHIVLTYHRSNVSQIPNEDQFRKAVQQLDVPPGEYMFP